MKKYLIITVLGLVASLFLFGYFNEIQSSGANTAELGKALEDAEKAIAEANKAMLGWEKELEKYEVEVKALKAQGVTTALQIWNLTDAAKALVMSSSPWMRLNELYAAIYGCYVQMDAVNGTLNQCVVTRDAALVAYNNSTSQKRGPINTPEYRTIPECGLPCNNFCGTVFSSSVEGFSGLSAAAAGKHKITCGESGSVSGCGVEHWECNGKSEEYKEHQVLYCGKDIQFWEKSGDLSPESLGVCGAPYRACSVTEGTHKYIGRQKYNSSSQGYYTHGYGEYVPLFPNKKHGDGTLAAPSHSINGPGGVDISSAIDETPNCSTCIDGSNHCPGCGSDSTENPIVSPPPPTPPPTPSPTYHACGEHETSASGDHSLQASCSSTDSNGNYCTVTNFYACDSHTHSYPAPPPPPTTVSCARAECGAEVSERLEHRVDNCSNCNAVYWTCYPNAIYNHETTFTCRRSGCGKTFTRCSNTPTACQSANYHWAQ